MNVFQRYSYLRQQIRPLHIYQSRFCLSSSGKVVLSKSNVCHDIVKKLVIPHPVTEFKFAIALHEIGHIHCLVPYQQHWGLGWYLILFAEIAAWQWAIEQNVLSEKTISYALNTPEDGLGSYIIGIDSRLSHGLAVHMIQPRLKRSLFSGVLDRLDDTYMERISQWFDVVDAGEKRHWDQERILFTKDVIHQYTDPGLAWQAPSSVGVPFLMYLRDVLK